jgi:hypothetical protein
MFIPAKIGETGALRQRVRSAGRTQMIGKAVICACCGSKPHFKEWIVVPGLSLWAVECDKYCFITDFFDEKNLAVKHWNAADVQKALAQKGEWERRYTWKN